MGAAQQSLERQVRRGAAWKVGAQSLSYALRLAFGLVLARLLTPEEYGLAGMALLLGGFVLVFSDLGLGAALVQRKAIGEDDRSTVFWASLGSGVACAAVVVGAAGPLAALLGEPDVEPLIRAMALAFVLASLGATQFALLTRSMDFRSLELRVLAGTLVSGAVGIGAAVAGAGAWAVVAQHLAFAAVSTLALWAATPWRPRLRFSTASLRDLGRFGVPLIGNRLVYVSGEVAQGALVGRMLGPAALGVYTVATNVVLLPLTRITIPVGEVLFPALSRLQDERERAAELWLRAVRLGAAFSLPALAALAVLAPDLVPLVLGSQWEDLVPVVQLLAVAGAVSSVNGWNTSVLLAAGRADVLVRVSTVTLVALVTAIAVGAQWGLVGVAAARAVQSLAVGVPYLGWVARTSGAGVGAVARALAGVAQATALMTAALLLGRWALLELGVPPVLRVVVLALLGLAAYAGACAWRTPDVASSARALAARRPRTA